jgi:hypothetical protein
MSQPGTSGQATQLAVLQAAFVSAKATEVSALTSYKAARKAAIAAQQAVAAYNFYYFGNSEYPGLNIIDGDNALV